MTETSALHDLNARRSQLNGANGVHGAVSPLPGVDPALVLHHAVQERRTRSAPLIVWGVALVLLAVPALVGLLYAGTRADVYVASHDVVHDIDDAQFGDAERVMANAKVEAERRDLAAEVAERYDLDTDDLMRRRSVQVVTTDAGVSTDVLRFNVEGSNRRVALREVDRLVGAYLARQGSLDPNGARRAEIEATIDELQASRLGAIAGIENAQEAKNDATFIGLTAAEYTERVTELDRNLVQAGSRYQEVVADLDAQTRLLAQLEPEGLRVSASAAGEPFAPEAPVGPRPLRSLALGLAIGLVLATTWLFITLQQRRTSVQ